MAKKTIITEVQEEEEPVEPLAYSIKRAAKALDIGRSSLLGLIDDKKIRVVYVGRKPIVPKSSIDEFLSCKN